MGYRTYLGSLSKKKYEETKNLTLEELNKYFKVEKDDYLAPYEILDMQNLFCFGKYENFGSEKDIYTQLDLEGEFKRISKEDLLHIADGIREKVLKHYKELLYAQTCNLTKKKLKKIHDREFKKEFKNINFELTERCERLSNPNPKGYVVKDLKQKIRVWTSLENVNSSWRWEYEFFNLREIINTFDFEKNILVYYGY